LEPPLLAQQLGALQQVAAVLVLEQRELRPPQS
jgi:hypothetical protein